MRRSANSPFGRNGFLALTREFEVLASFSDDVICEAGIVAEVRRLNFPNDESVSTSSDFGDPPLRRREAKGIFEPNDLKQKKTGR